MPDGKLHVKNKRVMERLLQQQQRAKTDSEIPELPSAAKIIEKLTKRVKKLESEVAVMRPTYEELLAWKMEQERKGGM